jgi:hypothetical protein
MTQTNYDELFAECVSDVESGAKHPCNLDDACFMQGGCPRCLAGVLRSGSVLDVAHIDVFEGAGVVRLTMSEPCKPPNPCVVFFKTNLKIHR